MSSLSQEDKKILRQLNRQPDLKKRIQSILSTAEDDGEGIVKADEAEGRIIEEVRGMGNEVLTEWAESRIEKSEAYLPADDNISRSGQKNTLAQYLRRNTCVRARAQATGQPASTVQSKCRGDLPMLFASPATCRNRLRRGSFLWSSSGKTERTLWDNIISKRCSSCHTDSCSVYI